MVHANPPVILGLKKSFGFGDRLGLAGPGHLAALEKSTFTGVLAQQSMREMTRTRRRADQVVEAAQDAVNAAHYTRPWGADADHLKTEADIEMMAKAGFTYFTLDPTPAVVNAADTMKEAELRAEADKLVREGVLGPDWMARYLGDKWEVDNGPPLAFEEEPLLRAAVKFARATAETARLHNAVARHCPDRPFEVEVAVDETAKPTSHREHLFLALELKRRGVSFVGLAPRFVGKFEKGIDYVGDISVFTSELERHAAIARRLGPYKISVHSGSDKFSLYPFIGRICGELLHIKTAGTSYLEALRVIWRTNPDLFREIARYAAEHFAEERDAFLVSTTEEEVATLAAQWPVDPEPVYFEERVGRQLLHVTFGSVLVLGRRPGGLPFNEAIRETLAKHADDYREALDICLSRHLELLEAG
ncbi:MAG: tagaturonate epimerase family protein [Verrucomicrobiota bacterium JB024]|nr:tagaturonate epimerase family protein [Verrucomicrobiota bacterium JB024]